MQRTWPWRFFLDGTLRNSCSAMNRVKSSGLFYTYRYVRTHLNEPYARHHKSTITQKPNQLRSGYAGMPSMLIFQFAQSFRASVRSQSLRRFPSLVASSSVVALLSRYCSWHSRYHAENSGVHHSAHRRRSQPYTLASAMSRPCCKLW